MTVPEAFEQGKLAGLNAALETKTAEQRLAWLFDYVQEPIVLSSSFGAQSAVSLHMVSRQRPDIPVILVDTGYLFPETYHFIDHLTERLKLNLSVYRPLLGSAWMEARHGRLWEEGAEGLDRYHQIRKVEPMNRALDEWKAQAWITGLRRSQSTSRAATPVLQVQKDRWKLNPLADWSDRQVWRYLADHDLPQHPLWEQGYVSIGDVHTTRRWEPGMNEEQTRFFGIKRECGLHV